MKISVTTIDLEELEVDLLIIPLPEEVASERLEGLAALFGPSVERTALDFSGRLEEQVLIFPEKGRAKRVVFFGLGSTADINEESVRTSLAEAGHLAKRLKIETAAMALDEALPEPDRCAQAAVEGFMLASYSFTKYFTTDRGGYTGPERLVLHGTISEKHLRRGVEYGRIVSESVCTARDLVNLSPDEKTPTQFGKAVEKSAKKYGYEAFVWDKALIEDEGMGGLLAVNRGSQQPPTFTVATWQPEHALNNKPIVLVGKGVMFDTGGLSLKPTADSMDMMKCDMAGAAAVVGAMEAVARLNMPLYVVGLIPATDNRPGENAYVPGDVVRMHNGKTVEVLNTDAEGRMILADALSYAATFRPELVVDIATLTGAVVVALGEKVAGLMANSQLAGSNHQDQMVAAGARSGERVYPLPMFDDYAKLLKSTVADMKNIGGRAAGTITAAKFLESFTSYPWMHLDIAGPAFIKQGSGYQHAGGTGFGVRLLVEFLRGLATRVNRS